MHFIYLNSVSILAGSHKLYTKYLLEMKHQLKQVELQVLVECQLNKWKAIILSKIQAFKIGEVTMIWDFSTTQKAWLK